MRRSVSDDGDEREGAVMPEESPTLVRSSNVFTPGDGHAVVAQRSCSYVAHIYVGGACVPTCSCCCPTPGRNQRRMKSVRRFRRAGMADATLRTLVECSLWVPLWGYNERTSGRRVMLLGDVIYGAVESRNARLQTAQISVSRLQKRRRLPSLRHKGSRGSCESTRGLWRGM